MGPGQLIVTVSEVRVCVPIAVAICGFAMAAWMKILNWIELRMIRYTLVKFWGIHYLESSQTSHSVLYPTLLNCRVILLAEKYDELLSGIYALEGFDVGVHVSRTNLQLFSFVNVLVPHSGAWQAWLSQSVKKMSVHCFNLFLITWTKLLTRHDGK